MSERLRVTFVTGETDATVDCFSRPNQTLLQVAQEAGLEIVATCGARGRCRSCRVKILQGDVPPPSIMDTVQLGHEEVQERFRLSCQTQVIADCKVMLAPPTVEAGHKILGSGHLNGARLALDSGVEKRVIKAVAPIEEHHQTSDIEEIFAALDHSAPMSVPLDVVRSVPAILRARDGRLTVTTFRGEIIDIEPDDTAAHKYGMAFDIGTTSIVGSLLNLDTGEELASVGGLNPQSAYGGDLMSRIAYVQFDEKKLQTLRARVLNAINEFIREACAIAKVSADHIYKIVVVGNTCMHHIVLGIDPSYVGLAPYAPVIRNAIVVPAKEVLIKTAPKARVCFLPIVAGFVGADTMACVLATRIYESNEIRALVDIGTNGEVVMGSKDRLMACSAPAGPALEGAQIRHGMRGAVGAIEKVAIDDDVRFVTIGDAPPIGICGSGLIDAAAAMLDAGILDESGLIRADRKADLPPVLARRINFANDRDQFVLVPADRSGKAEDITITQSDIRQLQLAKGAICSGVVMLQRVMQISDENLFELMLCGAFGNYISTASARRIRLLPPLPLNRVTYSGNAAALGAQMALLSETERKRAEELVRQIEHVALATSPDFQAVFVEALKFPKSEDFARADGAASG